MKNRIFYSLDVQHCTRTHVEKCGAAGHETRKYCTLLQLQPSNAQSCHVRTIYRIAGNFRAVQNLAFFADWYIGMCENKNHENLNRWSKYDVPVGNARSTWSHVRRARKLKTRKFLLEAPRATPRKFAPAKISRYTVSQKS